jgi:hypothetical protein
LYGVEEEQLLYDKTVENWKYLVDN